MSLRATPIAIVKSNVVSETYRRFSKNAEVSADYRLLPA